MPNNLHGRWAVWTRAMSANCSWWYVRHPRLAVSLACVFIASVLAFLAMGLICGLALLHT